MVKKIIKLLILLLRPLLGSRGCCGFTVTCSQYAFSELDNNRLVPALYNITKRIIRCNPVYWAFVTARRKY